MNQRQRAIAALGAVMLVIATAGTALADETVSKTDTMSILLGGIHVYVDAYAFDDVTYSLGSQVAPGSMQYRVADERGTQAGWSVTASASDFTGQNDPTHVIPSSNLVATGYVQTTIRGDNVGIPGFIGESWVATAPGGAGEYVLTAVDVALQIPAGQPVDTYESTLTLTLVAAP